MRESFFRLRHVDGSFRRIRARSGTVGTGGRPTANVGAHIDITDDHYLVLKEELLDSNERLQEFTRLASHDLRSPVRAIISLVGFVREDSGGEQEPAVVDHLAKIEARAERMNHLLDGLLDYARAGERASSLELIDPAQLIADVVRDIDPRGCRVVVEYSGPTVWTWAAPLATCVGNLVDNACKHHDRPVGFITVQAAVADGYLQLSVTDDGPGIPPQYRSQVFEPFRALKSSDEVEGSGIGLAVVRKIVKVHGGSIRLESEVGVGTRFQILWPLADGPDSPERHRDAEHEQHRAPASN
jgi:signal transduction histidine kinase